MDILYSSVRELTAGLAAVPVDRICEAWGEERAREDEIVEKMHGGRLWRCLEKRFPAVGVQRRLGRMTVERDKALIIFSFRSAK